MQVVSRGNVVHRQSEVRAKSICFHRLTARCPRASLLMNNTNALDVRNVLVGRDSIGQRDV
jgi:hypothetical protein